MIKIAGSLLALLLIVCLAMTQCEGYVNSTSMLSEDRQNHRKNGKKKGDDKPEANTKDDMIYNISDVKYHVDPETLKKDTKIMIKNRWGQTIEMPWSSAVETTPRYNPAGYFTYGPANYVPDYTDSILLSRGMRSAENEIDTKYMDIDNMYGEELAFYEV